jgi:hypothetical protein
MKHLLVCLLALLLNACGKAHISSIPDRPVYLELDLTFEDKDLLPVSAYKIYTSKNIHLEVERVGFGGVLVYHGISASGSDAYYAFDAACPYKVNSSVTLEVDDDHLYAVCPQCQSR